MPTLIVEDGTIVPNANTFVTDAELQTYASDRGFTLPTDLDERETLLIRAVDYITSVEGKMQGFRVSPDQTLPYPRYGVCVNGFDLSSDTIPTELKNAQMELAIQANESDILITGNVDNLASFDVDGVYSETYFSGGSWTQVRTDRADAYLDKLLVNSGASNRLTRF